MSRTDSSAGSRAGAPGWVLLGLGMGLLLALPLGASVALALPLGLVCLVLGAVLGRRPGRRDDPPAPAPVSRPRIEAAGPTAPGTADTAPEGADVEAVEAPDPRPAVSSAPEPDPVPPRPDGPDGAHRPTEDPVEPISLAPVPADEPTLVTEPAAADDEPSPATEPVTEDDEPIAAPGPVAGDDDPAEPPTPIAAEPSPADDPGAVLGPRLPLRIAPVRVRDAGSVDLGIGASAVALEVTGRSVPPYVRRDIDAALDDAMQSDALARTGGIVIARGPAASGLSRCLWEALRRNAGHRIVLAITSPDLEVEGEPPLAALLDAIPELDLDETAAPVVWIDDAHEHLGRGLTLSLLDRLVTALPGCIVALTVDAGRLALPELVPDPTERWLQRLSDPHELSPRLSAAELAQAYLVYPDQTLDRRLERLPSWFGGHEDRRERADRLRATDPVASAVLAAGAAWRRGCPGRSIPRSALQELTRAVLATDDRADVTEDDASIGAAIDRLATTDLGLLQAMDGDRYRAHATLPGDTPDPQHRASPQVWDTLVDHLAATAVEASIEVGRAALAADLPDVAQRAWTLASRASDAELAARGALHLGLLHEQRGDAGSARLAYQRAATGPTAAAPMAAFHLGGVLEQLDRPSDAEAAYLQALDSGHPDAAPLAAFNLGWLLEQRHRTEAAITAYDRAVASGHPDAAPMAAFNLGWLHERQRRNKEAELHYRAAIESGHPDVAPMAAVSLGVLFDRLRRPGEARLLFQRAASSGHAEAAAAARTRMGPSPRR